MPYDGEYATGHTLARLVDNPAVRDFDGEIKKSTSTATEDLPDTIALPRGSTRVKRLIAIDGSTVTSRVENGHPGAEASLLNIAAQNHQVAVNSTLAIDLTGQAAAESLGPQMYSGIGGQMTFMMGAMYSHGGRSIMVLPSTAKRGQLSRIVPMLEPGSTLTTPRQYADYVVTEFGIVNLQGKTQRQRAEALIEIAHPDFQPELKAQAKRMFWPV